MQPSPLAALGKQPPPKPSALPVVVEQVPADLRALDRWVLWRWELRDDKWTKPPHQPNGRYARSDTPTTWSTFDAAWTAHVAGGFDGIGVALTDDDDVAGIDLDHCVNNGVIDQWALDIAQTINSYTEISPSGTGLRIIVHAELPPGGRKRGDVECYETGRYLTITGHKVPGAPPTIQHRQAELDAFHAHHFPAPEQKAAINGSAAHLTDSQVLDLIRGSKQAAKFDALYRGDDTLHDDDTSKADLALIAQLAFYTQDEQQLDRLFQGSGRSRDKWAAKHAADGSTYGQLTINRALSKLDDTYTPPTDGPELVDAPVDPHPDPGDGDSDIAGPQPFQTYTLDDLADMDPPKWRIDGVLPDESLALLFGPSGSLKSFIAMDWGLSVASGVPWQGHQVEQGPVLYIAAEGGSGIYRRACAWLNTHKGADVSRFHVIPTRIRLGDPNSIRRLAATIDKLADDMDEPPALIIVDTWSRNTPGVDENSSEKQSKIIDELFDDMAKRRKCGVIVVHHTGHGDQGRERGSTALPGAADCRWKTKRLGKGQDVTLTCEKLKEWQEPDPIELRSHVVNLDPEVHGTEWDPEPTSLVLLTKDPFVVNEHDDHERIVELFRGRGELSQTKATDAMGGFGRRPDRVQALQHAAQCRRCPVESRTSGQTTLYWVSEAL